MRDSVCDTTASQTREERKQETKAKIKRGRSRIGGRHAEGLSIIGGWGMDQFLLVSCGCTSIIFILYRTRKTQTEIEYCATQSYHHNPNNSSTLYVTAHK